MATASRTWWGQRFIQSLEHIIDPKRLQRGKAYLAEHRITNLEITGSQIKANVRGNPNPYYDLHEVPYYTVTVRMGTIAATDWKVLIEKLGANALWITHFLQGQVPEDIETIFAAEGFPLLPLARDDFKTRCTCPDEVNPCKHVAGVFFRVASRLDEDPFLLFELRGMPREQLQMALRQTTLGKGLAQKLQQAAEPSPIRALAYRYPQPELEPLPTELDWAKFWRGNPQALPEVPATSPNPVAALLVKKQGDFPAFWTKEQSFLEVMESLYRQIRQKNRELL